MFLTRRLPSILDNLTFNYDTYRLYLTFSSKLVMIVSYHFTPPFSHHLKNVNIYLQFVNTINDHNLYTLIPQFVDICSLKWSILYRRLFWFGQGNKIELKLENDKETILEKESILKI